MSLEAWAEENDTPQVDGDLKGVEWRSAYFGVEDGVKSVHVHFFTNKLQNERVIKKT